MSDDKNEVNVNTTTQSNKFLPEFYYRQLPGTDPQIRRAHQLKKRHLTPLSFTNVLCRIGVVTGVLYAILTLIRFTLMDYIVANWFYLFLFGCIMLFVYLLYGQTVIKNAPDLKEELLFNGIVNGVCLILALVLASR